MFSFIIKNDDDEKKKYLSFQEIQFYGPNHTT